MDSQKAMSNTSYLLNFPFHLRPIPSHEVTPAYLFINFYPQTMNLWKSTMVASPKMLIE